MKKNNDNPLLNGFKAYGEKTEKEIQAENDWHDKVFEMVGDRPVESLNKAELIEYARALEMQAYDLSCAFSASKNLTDTVTKIRDVIHDRYIEVQSKQRKGAEVANQANREFWDVWKTRYRELVNDGVKIMDARRTVQKEIIADGGKEYALDGALKRQLKE